MRRLKLIFLVFCAQNVISGRVPPPNETENSNYNKTFIGKFNITNTTVVNELINFQ